LTYAWEQSSNNSTWSPATGSTNAATYEPPSGTAGVMYYRVVITDPGTGCDARTSLASTVTITPDLNITTNLANITECIGGSEVLTVVTSGGTGGALTYNWEQSTDNTTWGPATGASSTSNTYQPSASTAGTMYYRVSVGDAASGCGSAPSTAATVVVTPDLSITTNLANITECLGGSGTLTVATTGGTGGALSYTWEQSTDNTTWGPATAASSTSPTYTPSSSTVGVMYYRVSVGDAASGCGAAPSVAATVTITPDLSITTNLANITECIGGSNTLTVATTGGTGGALTYTWEQSSDNTTWAPATGASSTSPTYTPDASTAGTMYYRVSVGDAASGCGAAPSVAATVVVTPDLSITTNLANITECIGGSNTLTVATTGGTGGALSYTWEQSTNNTTWAPATGASSTSPTYTPDASTAGTMYYRVSVGDAASGCGAAPSVVATVIVTPDLTITTDLANITECIGGSNTLTVVTTGGTGGALTYTWEQSSNNTTWAPATGASSTSPTYTPDASTAGTMYYRVSVGDAASGCGAAPSVVATVVVSPDLNISTNLANITECVGGNRTLTVATTGGTGGALTYTWEQSTDNTTWAPATGASASSSTYQPASSAAGVMYYRVSVGDASSGCGAAPSVAATVTVTPDLSIAVNLTDITECVSGTLPLSITTTGGSGSALTYTWEQSDDRTTWIPAPGASSSSNTYVPPSTTSGVKYYRVSVADATTGCDAVPSVEATVTIVPKPTITATALTTVICEGGGVALSATPLNGTGTCIIQWQTSTDAGATFNDIPGATGPTYNTPALPTGQTKYKARISCDGNGCCN
jgi:large repetitive protein